MQYGLFSDTASSPTVMKLQYALGLPGTVDGKFTAAVGAALDAWLVARGGPTRVSVIAAALRELQQSAPSETPFTESEFAMIADAYVAYKKATGGVGWWFKRYWPWVVGGVVVTAAATVGTVYAWKHYHGSEPAGELGDLGCPCGLGHSGRTASYMFPSGRRHGHYKAATGRFHAH